MEGIDPKVYAMAFAAVWFVQIGVDLAKQAIGPNEHSARVLPLIGIMLGWIVVGAMQVYQRVEPTPDNIAGVLLAGIVANYLAASASMAHKTVRESIRQKRVQKVRAAGEAV